MSEAPRHKGAKRRWGEEAMEQGIHGTTDAAGLSHTAIAASAGSGKTFQLTNRYLQLLLAGAEPGSILASTFTRLAAGEIRDRILERLAEAACDAEKRRELARHVAGEGAAALPRDDVLTMLQRLVGNLHRLQVRTLDSFFAGIVRCFALELGVDPAARVVDEHEDTRLRREAIRHMLDERDPQPLINLLRVLADGTSDRSVTDSIDATVSGLCELYRDAPPQAWAAIEEKPMMKRIELLEAIERLAQTPSQVNGHFVNAHRSDCAKARAAHYDHADDWLKFLSAGLAKPIGSAASEYRKKPIEPEVIDAYQPIIRHARAVCWNSIVYRTRSTYELLDRFHRRYAQLKHDAKAMTFADMTDLVWGAHSRSFANGDPSRGAEGLAAGAGLTMEEICFRLDAAVHHLLLDEMQDTSIAQWRCLQPLIEEITAHRPPERTFFCVGDVKQSIYGWREACPEILESIGEAVPGIHVEGLAKSWRSAPVIMDTVNKVFLGIEDNEAMAAYPDAASRFAGCFEKHSTARTQLPGHVTLRTCPSPEGDDEEDAGGGPPGAEDEPAAGDAPAPAGRALRLDCAAELIQEIHRAAPLSTIGVLTRTNKTVSQLLYRLGPNGRGLPVAGRGGGALTDSAAVNAVLDLLRLADHPEHTAAAFNVMRSPLGEALGMGPRKDGRVSRRVSRVLGRRIRRRLLDRGYAATIHEIVAQIAPHTDQRQVRRLVQLEQIAAEHDRRPPLRPDDFIAAAEAAAVDDPGASPIQVMTVHQSKGLEFDVVVLPDLDERLVRTNSAQMLYERDGAAGPISRIARHVKREIWEMFPELSPLYRAHVTRQARESLCLLYVAMTRAKHALHMIVNPSKSNERTLPELLSSILRCAFAGTDPLDGDALLHDAGDPQWHERRETSQQADKSTGQPADTFEADGRAALSPSPRWLSVALSGESKPPLIPLAPSTGRTPRGRAAAAASADHEAAAPLGERLQLHERPARDRGTAIHRMFESVEFLDDRQPQREALLEIARSAAPRRGEQWAAGQVESFLEMIRQPRIAALLSRDEGPSGASRLWRERRYARLVDGTVQQGAIDRLHVQMEGGRPVSARIIDFKTDAIESTEVAARAERYRGQLETYRAAAAEALTLPPESVTMTVLFVTCGEAMDLK